MDFKALLQTDEYNFLRVHPRLGNRVILLGLSGSYAYGTANENSDVDFRGITLHLPSDLLGLTKFEQYEDGNTDTVIYSFNKIVNLLLECNPNTIELMGLDEEQYLIKTALGQEVLDHKSLFLSKRAAKSFGGYARAQLRRLQNAVARDHMQQQEREQHIYHAVRNALEDFMQKNAITDKGNINLYIDESDNPAFRTEIFMDAEYKHLPLRDYGNMLGVMNNVVREYDQIGRRSSEKDDDHLNKHAMHLIRIFMMAVDILEKGVIKTHRKEDLELLKSIRQGEFQKEDRTFSKEFYDIVSVCEKRLEKAAAATRLPDYPDMKKVGQFVEYVNRKSIEGEL